MRALAFGLLLLAAPIGVRAATAEEDKAACLARQPEMAKKAEAFQGDAQIRRLIAADLQRAQKEQVEGDWDECVEALDHAQQLLDGKF